jgi:hypothetical protein
MFGVKGILQTGDVHFPECFDDGHLLRVVPVVPTPLIASWRHEL